ncbi:MAG TPA: SGNH/GDSL hydrolase family protein [Ktedonobacteraceae bacterium]|nr:SGNH/GDSL hydrolase family protein [Ktedonobacteraceae bacterium]
MTLDRLPRARQARRNHRRTGPARYGRVNGVVFALLLCVFLLIGAGCAQNTTTVAGQSGTTTSHQQGDKQITYVAIGASDTFGIGTQDPYDDNWPTDLAALLGASHIHLINLGIPDITVHDALSLELPIALDSHPDLVTIWLGVNDIVAKVPPASYASDLNALLTRLRTNAPHARIAIANVPDLTLLPAFAQADQQALTQQIQAYNAIIASAAQQHHAVLVDLTTQSYNLQDHPEYISSDGLHPTDIGYQQLAKLFYQALQHQG